MFGLVLFLQAAAHQADKIIHNLYNLLLHLSQIIQVFPSQLHKCHATTPMDQPPNTAT